MNGDILRPTARNRNAAPRPKIVRASSAISRAENPRSPPERMNNAGLDDCNFNHQLPFDQFADEANHVPVNLR